MHSYVVSANNAFIDRAPPNNYADCLGCVAQTIDSTLLILLLSQTNDFLHQHPPVPPFRMMLFESMFAAQAAVCADAAAEKALERLEG